jgi:pyruvate/2-oxoglutarate dehydrogenase complex dihydrolipoamide acyltransferase (E2) component
MTGAEQILAEGLAATRRPDGYAVMQLDLLAAEQFRQEQAQETGVPLTMLDLIIRALAWTAGRDELLNATVHGRKVWPNEQVDIGLSVAATTSVAPVVVLRDADKKSLSEIHQERGRLLREALEQEAARRQELERQARLIPLPRLRSRVVGYLVNQAHFRQQNVGTLHISSIDLPDMEFYLPSHIATSLLLSVGGVKPRPLVVEDRIEIRPSAYVAFMIDQRMVHPVRAMRAFRRFRRLLENPERLLKEPGRDSTP